MSRPEHRHDDDRTGNGIVNHRPEGIPDTDPEQDGERKQHTDTAEVDGAEAASGTTAPGTDPEAELEAEPGGRDAGSDGSDGGGGGGTLTELFGGGSGGSGGPGGPGGPGGSGGSDGSGGSSGSGGSGGFGGEEMDEAALRRMLQGAVQDLEPSEGTLDHLYRAVAGPARQAAAGRGRCRGRGAADRYGGPRLRPRGELGRIGHRQPRHHAATASRPRAAAARTRAPTPRAGGRRAPRTAGARAPRASAAAPRSRRRDRPPAPRAAGPRVWTTRRASVSPPPGPATPASSASPPPTRARPGPTARCTGPSGSPMCPATPAR